MAITNGERQRRAAVFGKGGGQIRLIKISEQWDRFEIVAKEGRLPCAELKAAEGNAGIVLQYERRDFQNQTTNS